MAILDNQRRMTSGLVLGNAAEISVAVIRDIAGNDISTSLGGVTASRDVLATLVLQRITKRLKERVAKA